MGSISNVNNTTHAFFLLSVELSAVFSRLVAFILTQTSIWNISRVCCPC